MKKKQLTKQKNPLELWLCNQTKSRQILIFSKLFPSFHYYFKSFHLHLVYTESPSDSTRVTAQAV